MESYLDTNFKKLNTMLFRILSLFIATLATHISAAEFFVLPGTKTLLMMGETKATDVPILYSHIMQDKIDGLILKGPGGDLDAGYDIADVVLKFGLNITVPENTECASACSIIFSTGKKRTLEEGASLGFHLPFLQLKRGDIPKYCAFVEGKKYDEKLENSLLGNPFASVDPNCLEKTYQQGLKDIRKLQRYLDRDNIKPEVLDIVINTPSAEMAWIKKERAATLGLTN